MRILKIITTLLFVLAYLKPERIIPYPDNAGKIESISQVITEPVPMRQFTLKKESGTITAFAYESGYSYKVGDEVLYNKSGEMVEITERLRTYPVMRLFLIFTGVVLLVSGGHGLKSMVGLIFSFGVIFNFLIPTVLAGYNPLLAATGASAVILIFTYLLTHGKESKTYLAMVGTLLSLIIAGVLSQIFATQMGLSGHESEEVLFLAGSIPAASIFNLMLAGIMIASLGVLDDITISQASIVKELSQANNKFTATELYTRAMNVGHDHIASLVNTLVLVYAGSSLPLLLLFVTSGANISELLSYQAVTTEILRTLAGSIGLVIAVPITTLLSAYYYRRT